MMKFIRGRLIVSMVFFLVISFCGFNVYADQNTKNNKVLDEIDKYLNGSMNKLPVPGMSIVIVKDDAILFSKGYGVESIDTNQPMTKNSSSAIGSLTKSFTAVAMLQLVEHGKVSLEDLVIKHIPWFKTLDEENSRKITIKMLLSNTSGLPTEVNADKLFLSIETSNIAREEFIRSLSTISLNEEPGQAYEYSNAGFVVAGYIIEKVTDMTYENYIEENILKPLDMDRSTTKLEYFDNLNVLYGHTAGINASIVSNKLYNIIGTPAGSELRCSASDLGNYLAMLLNDGVYKNKQIISQESINRLFEPVISFKKASDWGEAKEWDMSYALGFMRGKIDGEDILTHGGNTRTMSSRNLIDKKEKIGIQLLFNVGGINKEKYQITEMLIVQNVMQILKNKKLITGTNNDTKTKNNFILSHEKEDDYIGNYTNSSGTIKMTIERDNSGRLFAESYDINGKWQYEIEFLSPSRIKMANTAASITADFSMTSDGKVTGFSMGLYGNMIKLPDDMYSGYTKHQSPDQKISFLLSKEYEVNWQREGFIVTDKNDTIIVLGERGIDITKFNERKINEFKNRGKVMFESNDYKENISLYICREKILTVEEGDIRKQIIIVSMKGKHSVGITAEVPYGSATNVIRDIILDIINTLE